MFRAFNPFRDRRQVKSEPAPPATVLPATSTLPDGKPDNFGECWNRPHADIDWFTWMYNGRIEQHLAFQQWFKTVDREQRIESVLEFGCGLGVGYAEFLADRAYTGTDIAPHLTEWCRANRHNALHTYIACDFVVHPFPDKYDLVFSHGTIDNNYDMDEFLRAAVRASRNWVFITAYRGFFCELASHRLEWRETDGCYYNDLSPSRAVAVLKEAGCLEVAVVPSFTGRKEIPYETMIVARVQQASP